MRDIDEFVTALELLGDMRGAYLEASKLLEPKPGSPGHFIANALMTVACKHTTAFLNVAMIPEPGSHIESAWSILRTLYEASVTACLLVKSKDPQTQQERLLMYCSGELEHGGRIGRDVDAANPSEPPLAPMRMAGLERLLGMAASHTGRRNIPKKPSVRQMMRDCGIPDSQYSEFYSFASHRIHGGSSSFLNWFEGKYLRDSEEPDYGAWFLPMQGAAWSLGEGGAVVLERQEAPEGLVKALRDERTELSKHLVTCYPQEGTTD